MRQLTSLLSFILFAATLYGQKRTMTNQNSDSTVSFIVKFDKKNATKDGYYLGGYVVNIAYQQSKRLNGKTIKITGKVSVVQGLGPYNQNDTTPVVQGRMNDTKHIAAPIIEIVKSKN